MTVCAGVREVQRHQISNLRYKEGKEVVCMFGFRRRGGEPHGRHQAK